ncbi:hypothetical protein Dd1591_3678 [Dickeya chrysanthemi Ech1591]|uniref:Uncharacterized protein n=1 Tax=Dickeya chrysanthemi (strain Ech1591) TaxID=561229 RepID=C6CLI3_DICC1|nr:hypothetical protein Dd1591_3678 [Dickeya chrysanthemi Ech1591]
MLLRNLFTCYEKETYMSLFFTLVCISRCCVKKHLAMITLIQRRAHSHNTTSPFLGGTP